MIVGLTLLKNIAWKVSDLGFPELFVYCLPEKTDLRKEIIKCYKNKFVFIKGIKKGEENTFYQGKLHYNWQNPKSFIFETSVGEVEVNYRDMTGLVFKQRLKKSQGIYALKEIPLKKISSEKIKGLSGTIVYSEGGSPLRFKPSKLSLLSNNVCNINYGLSNTSRYVNEFGRLLVPICSK